MRQVRLLLALLAAALTVAAPAQAANFTKRFAVNDSGNIAIVGNVLMTCPASGATCADAKNATTSGADRANNDHKMVHVDVDGDSSTFNSSTATLELPAGSTVLFAGMYWSARTSAGTGGAAAPNAGAKNKAKLKAPGGTYTTITATSQDVIGSDTYQQFADVTSQVQAGGNGVWTAADVQASTGQDRYAGWSLVVAYRNPAQPPRNLSVFDGLVQVNTSNVRQQINVSGFTTAPSGPVRTTLGVVAYEGDQGLTGDGLKLENTQLSNGSNPVDDFFNSSVTTADGTRVRDGRNPSQNNHLGYDADLVQADGILANSATSARLEVNTKNPGGEAIYPGVLTFASELLAAKVRPATRVTDLNGGNAEYGDVLEYETSAENIGNGDALELSVRTALPAGVELVPGSLRILDGPGSGGPLTPAAGDDQAVYDETTRTISWRLGTGATSEVGGTLGVGTKIRVTYQVKILTPPDGAPLEGDALARYRTAGTTDVYSTEGTATPVQASGPDLALTLTRTGDLVRGTGVSYALAVQNVGGSGTRGLTRVTDELPAGLDLDGVPAGTGWTCGVVARTVTCDRSDVLAPGANFPSIVVPATVRQDSGSSAVNAATVSGVDDGVHGNDSAADTAGTLFSRAALSTTLTGGGTTVSIGDTVTLTAKVANAGPSAATGVQVALPVPAGFALVSATGPGAACVDGTCPVGTIASGSDASVTYVLKALRAGAGSAPTATVTTTTAVTDTTTDDDERSTTLTIRPRRGVALTQVLAPTAPIAGAEQKLELSVANAGPSTATGVVVTEPLPADLTDPAATIATADGTCAITAGTLRCTLTDLAAGASVAITVTGTVKADAAARLLAATATLDAVPDDETTSDDTASVSHVIAARADVSLTAITAPAGLRAGHDATWTLRVANAGPSPASNAVVTVDLPGALSPTGPIAGCTLAARTLTCAVDALAAGAHHDVDLPLALRADATGGPVQIAASAAATEPDPDAADRALTLDVAVQREADLAVTQALAPAALVAGRPVTATATVTNAGPADAANVVVTQTLPATLDGASARIGATPCTIAARVVTCAVPALAVGARAEVVTTATVAPGAAGEDVAVPVTVASDDADPALADNAATSTAPVTAVSDLSVGAVAPTGTIAKDATAEFSLLVRNDGPSAAGKVVLRSLLPRSVEVVGLDPRCTVADRTITCLIDAVAVGDEVGVRIRVQATRAVDGALLGAVAAVSTTAGVDPSPANDAIESSLVEPPEADERVPAALRALVTPAAATAPAATACTSRRNFTIRLRIPRAAKLKSVAVTVGGKPVKVRVGKRHTAIVDLRGRRAGRVLTRIAAVTKGGRRIVGTRAYQTCAVKRPATKAPRI